MPRMRWGVAAVMARELRDSALRGRRSRDQGGEDGGVDLAALGGVELHTRDRNLSDPADRTGRQRGPVLGQLAFGNLRHHVDLIGFGVVVEVVVEWAGEQ